PQLRHRRPPRGRPAARARRPWSRRPVRGGGPARPRPYASVTAPATDGPAIASLTLGVLWIYWIGSVLALIFGYIAPPPFVLVAIPGVGSGPGSAALAP